MDICKCCENKHGIKDLNAMNECCYQSCANRMGADNIESVIDSPCGNQCKLCVDRSKLAQGRTLQYLDRIQPPVIWESFEEKQNYPVFFSIGFLSVGFFLAFFIIVFLTVIFRKK